MSASLVEAVVPELQGSHHEPSRSACQEPGDDSYGHGPDGLGLAIGVMELERASRIRAKRSAWRWSTGGGAALAVAPVVIMPPQGRVGAQQRPHLLAL